MDSESSKHKATMDVVYLNGHARGRWIEILSAFGADPNLLDGKPHPCPACGGTDRFTFDDKHGKGDFFCRKCDAGNGVQLVQRMRGISFCESIEQIARHLGIWEEEAKLVMPVPPGAPAVSFLNKKLAATPTQTWRYLDADGSLLGYVCRFETGAGKTIRTRTLFMQNGKPFWCWKNFPKPRPLYGLDRLAQRPDAPVLVVEGEKCADAAIGLMPEYVCISAYQGAQSPHTCDWSPVRGRELVIWPDNDKAGIDYAQVVGECALEAGAVSVKAIDLACIAASCGTGAAC